jgi:glycosyltransferase involved in cell wall biosynthesis
VVEWHLITGEYPPQPGGVSDYSQLVARGLAAAGDCVHVWVPEHNAVGEGDPCVAVHRLPGHFGRRALACVESALRSSSDNRRLLVQYVPHAFGSRAMNVPFCWWLYQRRKRERIVVMFHEVAYPLRRDQPLRHNVLGCVTRFMASLVARSAERCFVSTAAWMPLVRTLRGRTDSITCLPVPSNLPEGVPSDWVAATRAHYAVDGTQLLVGHFGTFGARISALLKEIFPRVLEQESRWVGLFIGRGSDRLARELAQDHPAIASRVFATGELDPASLAAHLAACDLLVQPYPDGISTRRTSVMAGLALGVPIVSTRGRLTEALWEREGLVAMESTGSPEGLAQLVHRLTDSAARRSLGQRGQIGYQSHFRIDRTIGELRAYAERPVSGPTAVPASHAAACVRS